MSPLQAEKAYFPIRMIVFNNVILVRDVPFLKASSPILVTPFGIISADLISVLVVVSVELSKMPSLGKAAYLFMPLYHSNTLGGSAKAGLAST